MKMDTKIDLLIYNNYDSIYIDIICRSIIIIFVYMVD